MITGLFTGFQKEDRFTHTQPPLNRRSLEKNKYIFNWWFCDDTPSLFSKSKNWKHGRCFWLSYSFSASISSGAAYTIWFSSILYQIAQEQLENLKAQQSQQSIQLSRLWLQTGTMISSKIERLWEKSISQFMTHQINKQAFAVILCHNHFYSSTPIHCNLIKVICDRII